MEQNCGNCVYMDVHDHIDRSEWGYGKYTGYKCTEKRQYMHPEKDGHSCSYHRFIEDKGNDGCFITTIVVKMCGFSENSKALKTLRRFRNRILQNTEDGRNALKMYDVIGPVIAQKLSEEKDSRLLGYKIYSEDLMPALEAIENNEYYEAMVLYKGMVERLSYQLDIKIDVNNYEYDSDVKNKEMGHGTARVHKVNVKN